jgi:hypothetical protein
VAVLLVVVTVVLAMYLYGLFRPQPTQVHVSWQNDPKTTMTVIWRSSKAESSTLKYGQTNLGKSVEAVSEPYESGYLHTAEISGLEPGKKYRFKCGGEGEWSRTRSFETAPADSPMSSFTFSFICDSRSQPEVRRRMAGVLRSKGSDLIIDAGDLVSNGQMQDQWDQWFEDMGEAITATPLMSVVGNHEKNSELFYMQFALPGGEEYYSFDYGNAHFVGLNSEILINGTQAEWLEDDLARARVNPSIVWVFAYFHAPVFTASSHSGRDDIQDIWGPIMDKYDVDLVFVGHNHCYERTSALFSNGTITDSGQRLVDPAGTVHITSGAFGAPLYDVQNVDFMEHARKLNNFVRIEIKGKQLELKAIGETGSTFDTLVIQKS